MLLGEAGYQPAGFQPDLQAVATTHGSEKNPRLCAGCHVNRLTGTDVTTGKPLIDAERVAGLSGVYASPIGASDRVYLVGRDGTCVVIKNADKYEVLATNRLDDPIDASPAAVDKELFLRSSKHLYCIADEK